MNRPACVFCFTGLLTMLAAVCLPQAAFWPLAAFCVMISLLAGVFLHFRPLFVMAAAVTVSCLLWLNTQQRYLQPANDFSDQTVTVTAIVTETGHSYVEDTVSATLRVVSIDGNKTDLKIYCPCLPSCELGDVISATVVLFALPENNHSWGNFADGIFLEAEYLADYRVVGKQLSLRIRMRQFGLKLSGKIRYYLEPSVGAVLAAMTTGDRRYLSYSQRTMFRRAGLSHILVVSGLHVSALCGLVFPSKRTRRKRVIGAWLSIMTAVFMMYIVGFSPSVVRAGVAALILNFGILLMRPGDSFTALAVAVFGMSVGNIYVVCDVALQLSFAAALGVLCSGLPVERLKKNAWADTPNGQRIIHWLHILSSTACACAFTFPILVFWGMEVSVVSLVSNLFVLWLSRPILIFGFGTAVFGLAPMLYPLQRCCGFVAGVLVRILMGLAKMFSELPGSQLYFETPYAGIIAVILLIYIAVGYHNKTSWKRIVVVCTLVLCFSTAIGVKLSRGITRIAFVGNSWTPAVIITQDDSAVVLYRGGNYNLVQIQNYLERRGIEQPDIIVDLRYSSQKECPIKTEQYKALRQIPEYTVDVLMWNDVLFLLTSHGKGGIVRIELVDTSFIVTTGSPDRGVPIQADYLLASSGNASWVMVDAILTRHLGYKWLDETTGKDVYYGQKELCFVIRQDSRYWIKGAS